MYDGAARALIANQDLTSDLDLKILPPIVTDLACNWFFNSVNWASNKFNRASLSRSQPEPSLAPPASWFEDVRAGLTTGMESPDENPESPNEFN